MSRVSSLFFFFFLYCSASHRDLHSFPTRRSSDLHVSSLVGAGTRGRLVGSFVSKRHIWRAARNAGKTVLACEAHRHIDRKSTRLNSSHEWISYAVFCLKKKKKKHTIYNCRHYANE